MFDKLRSERLDEKELRAGKRYIESNTLYKNLMEYLIDKDPSDMGWAGGGKAHYSKNLVDGVRQIGRGMESLQEQLSREPRVVVAQKGAGKTYIAMQAMRSALEEKGDVVPIMLQYEDSKSVKVIDPLKFGSQEMWGDRLGKIRDAGNDIDKLIEMADCLVFDDLNYMAEDVIAGRYDVKNLIDYVKKIKSAVERGKKVVIISENPLAHYARELNNKELNSLMPFLGYMDPEKNEPVYSIAYMEFTNKEFLKSVEGMLEKYKIRLAPTKEDLVAGDWSSEAQKETLQRLWSGSQNPRKFIRRLNAIKEFLYPQEDVDALIKDDVLRQAAFTNFNGSEEKILKNLEFISKGVHNAEKQARRNTRHGYDGKKVVGEYEMVIYPHSSTGDGICDWKFSGTSYVARAFLKTMGKSVPVKKIIQNSKSVKKGATGLIKKMESMGIIRKNRWQEYEFTKYGAGLTGMVLSEFDSKA